MKGARRRQCFIKPMEHYVEGECQASKEILWSSLRVVAFPLFPQSHPCSHGCLLQLGAMLPKQQQQSRGLSSGFGALGSLHSGHPFFSGTLSNTYSPLPPSHPFLPETGGQVVGWQVCPFMEAKPFFLPSSLLHWLTTIPLFEENLLFAFSSLLK